MTNSIGVTFIRGMWYNCNYLNYFFQYDSDRLDGEGGVNTLCEYKDGRPARNRHNYISNTSYLRRATLATPEELVALGIKSLPHTNDSYSVF